MHSFGRLLHENLRGEGQRRLERPARTATSGTLVLRKNPDADLPGCNANDEGENDRGLTATDTKT
jgi:hypothetical protein